MLEGKDARSTAAALGALGRIDKPRPDGAPSISQLTFRASAGCRPLLEMAGAIRRFVEGQEQVPTTGEAELKRPLPDELRFIGDAHDSLHSELDAIARALGL